MMARRLGAGDIGAAEARHCQPSEGADRVGTVLVWVAIVLCAAALVAVLRLRHGLHAYRASLDKIVRGIVKLRRMAGVSPRLVPLPKESADVTVLARAEPNLERVGLYGVGDFQELGADGKPAGAVRWFVSGDGTVCGWLGVTPAGPVMLLLSEVPRTGFVTTLRAPQAPCTATPPTVVEQRLAWKQGLDTALHQHRTAVARLGRPLAVEGVEGALGAMDSLKAHVAAWRSVQDPKDLLEADVRKILGDRYRDLGKTVLGLVRLAEASANG